jgi:hypothetical protein
MSELEMGSHTAVLAPEPRVLPARGGRFLAVSPPGAPLQIGVIGATEDEARLEYSAALDRWHEILNRS